MFRSINLGRRMSGYIICERILQPLDHSSGYVQIKKTAKISTLNIAGHVVCGCVIFETMK